MPSQRSSLYKNMCLLVVCLQVYILVINAFNLSPKPNLIFKEPDLKTFMPKMRSSYFGYTLNLREQSVIIGAPRAQSSLESQRKINESGAIYKCPLATGSCFPYLIDTKGNILYEDDDFAYNSEKKDYQWLGGSMDGGPKESDKFVVCAPRLVADLKRDYLFHGVCYWLPNTLDEKPRNVKKIAPLRLKQNQIRQDNKFKYFYHIFGEQGISVHITENNEEILIGAPGVLTWKGTIIRYYGKEQEDIGGLSRRDSERRIITKRQTRDYVSDVPDPLLWDQPNDSYFGYSVTSGYFEGSGSTRLSFVASAPQANNQEGEVYIFDIISGQNGKSIKKLNTFKGKQFGEYFGYSVLSEDFNGNGLPDLAISAPLHSIGQGYDNGAVYIFINKGNLNFERQHIITVSTIEPARFGTTLSRLGDINKDGYNDIAIGAPFEGNGAVYIFLGTEKGLSEKPSQVIRSPDSDASLGQMFGHGLSKGADIDSNQFNDLAIGAPNAEKVFVYKAYPVVKIFAYTESLSRELKIDQNKFQIRACWRIESKATNPHPQRISLKLKVDSQFKRVKLQNDQNEISFEENATAEQKCQIFDARVTFSNALVYKPIDLEIHYKLTKKIPETEEFCYDCVAVNPFDAAVSISKTIFSTGCKSEVCVADLKLLTPDVKTSFILGSSRTFTIDYEIVNAGETAFLPQINITTSNGAEFAKIPSKCKADNSVLLCDLFNGRPMVNGAKEKLSVVFDTSNFEGTEMTIFAEISSTGKEMQADDNYKKSVIALLEHSEIEFTGYAQTPVLNLEEGLYIAEITNSYEIRNHGPSRIKSMEVILSIPISYAIPNSENQLPLVNISSLVITGTYRDKNLEATLSQNNTILVQNAFEVTSTTASIPENNVFDLNSIELSHSLKRDKNYAEGKYDDNLNRKRRDVSSENVDGQKIMRQTTLESNEELSQSLPVNRTIFFNCIHPDETSCVQITFQIYDILADNNIVNITVKYKLDLELVNKILVNDKEFFVLTMSADIFKMDDQSGKSMDVRKLLAHNIVSKHQIKGVPIWAIILAVLFGLIVLASVIYGLYKCGFFRREKKEELQKLHRESQRVPSDGETEDEQ